MTDDPGIVCFQHSCQPATKIFCYQLPASCPCCSAQLSATQLMPFRLPYPFVRPHQHPCAIILKPTNGDFMNDYFNAKDLHIGVTTSAGTIVEFDERGLRQTPSASNSSNSRSSSSTSASSWSQSLLVDAAPEAWWEHWDEVLATICSQRHTWAAQHYHSGTHNCYTFVLRFMQQLGWGRLSRAAHNRHEFCAQFIVPRTTTAGKYISLYRKLRSTAGVGCYVHRSGDAEPEREMAAN